MDESSQPRPIIDFWATLDVVSEHARAYISSIENWERAPWRPGFFYVGETRQGYMIFPVSKEGDEFGFSILDPQFRENVHRHRIVVGTKFLVGASLDHVQAYGVVTRTCFELG